MDLKYNAIETKWNLLAKLKYIVDYKRKILKCAQKYVVKECA